MPWDFDEFIKERKYLQNVPPRTVEWYEQTFKWLGKYEPTEAGCKAFIIGMRDGGLKPRCVRARPEIFRQEGQDAFREQTRELLDSIDPGILVGKRDGALIALMTYTSARVSAATYGIKLRGQEKR